MVFFSVNHRLAFVIAYQTQGQVAVGAMVGVIGSGVLVATGAWVGACVCTGSGVGVLVGGGGS